MARIDYDKIKEISEKNKYSDPEYLLNKNHVFVLALIGQINTALESLEQRIEKLENYYPFTDKEADFKLVKEEEMIPREYLNHLKDLNDKYYNGDWVNVTEYQHAVHDLLKKAGLI